MGAYLSKPICEKESEDKESDVLSYGASAMQGWRLSQEVRSESRKPAHFFVHIYSRIARKRCNILSKYVCLSYPLPVCYTLAICLNVKDGS